MLETLGETEIERVVGHEVLASDGKSAGFVDVIFRDVPTGRAEWLGVWSGLPGTPRRLLPVRGVTREDQARLRAPWPYEVIDSAPAYDEHDDRGLLSDDPDGIHIPREKERKAYAHYGVEPLTEAPAGDYVTHFRAVVVIRR